MNTNEMLVEKLLNMHEALIESEHEQDRMEVEVEVDRVRAECDRLHQQYLYELSHAAEVSKQHTDMLEQRIKDMAPQKQFRIFGHRDTGNGIEQYALTIMSVTSINGVTAIDVALPDA